MEGPSRTIKLPSVDVGHVSKKGYFHECLHSPVQSWSTHRGASCCRGVHREIHMVAEQTEKGYGEVGEAHWAPGEVGRVVEAVENAPKLSIG